MEMAKIAYQIMIDLHLKGQVSKEELLTARLEYLRTKSRDMRRGKK